jgi:hypothetical protein
MSRYRLQRTGVLDTDGMKFIPPDPRNDDWQEYLAWQKAGNRPDAAPPEPGIEPDFIKAAIATVYKLAADKGQWQPSEVTDVELRQKIAEWQSDLSRSKGEATVAKE